MFEKLGGRKMVAATLTVAVGVGITVLKGDIPSNLLYLLISVFGVFAGANSINTIGSLSLEKKQLETQVQPASNPSSGIPVQDAVVAFQDLSARVEAHNNEQKAILDTIVKSASVTQNALSVIAEKVLSR